MLELSHSSVELEVCAAHCSEAQAIARQQGAIAYRLGVIGPYDQPADWWATTGFAERLRVGSAPVASTRVPRSVGRGALSS